MRLSLTAVVMPPPHLVRVGVPPERFAKTCLPAEVAGEIDAFIRSAEATGVFAANGCVTVTIQRAPTEQAT